MNAEKFYLIKRIIKAHIQSILFYFFRIFPVEKNKIVFSSIEGTSGYSCNPKYIAEKFLEEKLDYELVWLVNDVNKEFPRGIKKVHNSLWNRAYHLTTAMFWVDNSRKQLEVRKRKNQIYIQTWHAKLGFKPTCLDRGKSFSKIAYMVSRHDSDMIDYMLSNSDWYDRTLHTGMLYDGPVLKVGSPRCDILINDRDKFHKEIRTRYGLRNDDKVIMYAPTFRGGSQKTNRKIDKNNHMPDFEVLRNALHEKFGGNWIIFLRLHPQLTSRDVQYDEVNEHLVDVSKADDMYEILAGCDAFLTDYSSAAFDAITIKIPVIIYADDYNIYEKERGKMLWNLDELPFLLIKNENELRMRIINFNEILYLNELRRFVKNVGMVESGYASHKLVNFICDFYSKTENKKKENK